MDDGMDDELERRWDDAVETAWRGFRQRLADRLAELERGGLVMIDTGPHEDAAWCQVLVADGRLEVDAMRGAETGLSVELGAREVDRAAVMVVEALRETYGVVHPAFLDVDGLETDGTRSDGTRSDGAVRPLPSAPPAPQGEKRDLDRPVAPSSVEDVRAVIDLAVADLYDEAPEWDEDGDLPLPTDDRLVWVTVHKDAPRVLLSCLLVDDVADEQAALVEVNRLNRTEFGLTFSLTEQRISVTRELGLGAAVPAAVRGEVNRLLSQVDGWARDLGERLRTAPEPPPERQGSRFETAYAVMAELERDERGSVGPATMVRIFGNDTGLLLKAIRITERRRRDARTRAREARDQKQRTREKVARARHDYLRDLTARMRAGLRLMVDAPVRKVQVDQLALFDEDEAGTGR
ncbi:hypothetical protein GCM10011376_33930 [Nocardioides flavus (ex Wang et al. 2016)]|uniref:YbjN domain-containing protein n=2 Tax=Nocardioides flavus (ex Wang et al. 2016) TaxID=2058780 RepID=A0ABQ3HPG1_9ACTN|nr:hypothetical protein GCM10011376_33930 [Nocardioides flavus (ex Wang et al. 2016)]